MARVAVRDVQALVHAPASGCLRGGMSASALMLRELTRRGYPNGAAQPRREFGCAPPQTARCRLPRSAAKESQTVGKAFFGDFPSQRKLLRRRAHTPAPARSLNESSKIKQALYIFNKRSINVKTKKYWSKLPLALIHRA